MKRLFFYFLLLVTLLLAASCSSKEESNTPGVTAKVPNAPVPVMSDEKLQIAYEIKLSNYLKEGLTLNRVEIYRQIDDSVFATVEGDELFAATLIPSDPLPTLEELAFTGKRANPYVVFWLSVFPDDTILYGIYHKLYFKRSEYPQLEEIVIEGAATSMGTRKPRLIASPVRGERWVAIETTSNDNHHRMGIISVNDHYRVPQRYAVDWMQLTEEGTFCDGVMSDVESYPGYGQELLAVADGTVIEIMDGLEDNIPPDCHPVTPENVAGNHVILDIGDDTYALYAHMIPGSVTVEVGDQVFTGDVLGLLGNSGNSTGPHLHFHLCDEPSALGCEGVPYIFDSFFVSGLFNPEYDFTDFYVFGMTDERNDEIPASCVVVNFPE